jgi:pSer/pThr/pTyr-binding forkhead associated (FHA) protein
MSGAVIVIFILRILLAALLFGFLFWAMAAIWRDLRAQGQFISAPVIPNLSLTRLDSNEEDDHAPEVFSGPEVVVGRSVASDYPVADETVSARHARLSFHHNHWWVEDFRSTNGTFLNDERVSVPTVIVAGDELRVGQVSLLIGIADRGQ